ncbi:unnamed protein product, partial [Adineta steineri]
LNARDFAVRTHLLKGQGRSQSQCTDADPLDLLLSSVDSQGQSFTNEEIKDQTLTFIFVDYEITSHQRVEQRPRPNQFNYIR